MTRRVPRKLILAASALLALTAPAYADWQGQVTPRDIERLAHLNDARDDALAQARQRGGKGDYRAIEKILRPAAHAVPEQALVGNWRCRQIKLGGMSGYYVFDWFNCRISKTNSGIWFEKAGTQRMAGTLYPQEGMWVYLGAQSAKGEPLHRYSGRAASAGSEINPDDQIGALVGIGDNHLRIDLPAPSTQESDFDTIELKR
ncbi:MAG: DUF4893 domain-containing protein [Rhizomicrobium sp.]